MRFSRSTRVPLTIMILYLMATGKANNPLCKVHNRCHDQQLDFSFFLYHLYEIWRIIIFSLAYHAGMWVD
jgi:hypothetical protein